MGEKYRLGVPFLIGLSLFLFLAELASPISLSPAAAASLESTDDTGDYEEEEIDEFPTLDETELYYEEFPPEEDFPTEEYFDEEGTPFEDEYLEGTPPAEEEEEAAPPAVEVLSPTPGVDLFRAEDDEMSQALDPRLLEATLPLSLPPTATATPAPTRSPDRLSSLPVHWSFFAIGLLGALLLGVLGWILIKPSR